MSVVALLFFFSTQYPVRRRGRTLWWALAAFVPAVALIAVLLDSHLRAIATSSGETYALFHRAFTVFQASLLIYTAGAVANFLLSYRAARSSEERKRLQWIIWGLTIGAAPFLLFYILPQILFSRYLIPEEYTTICFVVIAGAFTISFLRYRMFDIDLLINRSIVYSAISLFLLVAYGLVVLLVASIVGGERVFEESILIAVGTLIIALLLNPLRSRIQGVVDQTFYATRVHYHRTIRSLSELLHGALTSTALFEQLGASLVSSLPLNTFAAYRVTDGALRLRYHRGGTPPLTIRLSTPTRAVLSSTSILALPSIIDRPGEQIDIAHAEILATLRVPLCLSLLSERHMLLGVLLLTPYSDNVRFREEEVDFLLTAGRQAGAALERLLLQEQLFRQQEESQRSQELSRLKSYFVSSVSHELRMPLTSIRMFAETLRTHRVTAKDRQEYLSIIEGESERLTRLIENILDFASIERGGKEYRARRVSFAPIVQRAVQSMQYPMRKHDARLRTHLPKRLPPIEADPDALEQVIINLLSNALKYSLRPKRIWLTARPRGPFLEIEVRDRGIGIPAEEIPRLFEPFHRVRDPAVAQVGGAGLGLALVKHIVDAHHGQISIRSAVSRGTAVLVTLPLHQPTEGTTP
jgi:signal transduction histidine kinase